MSVSAVCMLLAGGCGRHQEELQRIDALCDVEPRQAVFALDSIDYGALSEKERHYFDLLYVKSRDKAYARHASDSLILDAINYYSKHRECSLYPQALFYGGRVCSHLGDIPTAIEYYRNAAEALSGVSDNVEMIRLRAEAQSMAGRLLAELQRRKAGIPLIRRSIYDLRQLNDSAGIAYDNLSLVKIFADESDFDMARHHLLEAVRYSDHIREEGKAWIQAEKASLLMREGKDDSAMMIMRPLTRLVDSLYQTYAYRPTGKFFKDGSDAEYLYAKELSFSRDFNGRVVVTQMMHPLIPKDSAHSFVMEYESRHDADFARYESPEEMMQKTRYNYDRHLKARMKAEAEKRRLIWGGAIILLIAAGAAVYYWIRSLKNELRLLMALNLIERMEFALGIDMVENHEISSPARIEYARRIKALPAAAVKDARGLKDELLARLQAVSGDGVPEPTVDEELEQSEEMKTLQGMLAEGKGIAKNDEEIWTDIEKAVEAVSPGFRSKLDVLSSGKMTKSEYQVALLARFGITPKNISLLLFRSKSAITDRRSSLARKIFGKKADTHSLDRLILRL